MEPLEPGRGAAGGTLQARIWVSVVFSTERKPVLSPPSQRLAHPLSCVLPLDQAARCPASLPGLRHSEGA